MTRKDYKAIAEAIRIARIHEQPEQSALPQLAEDLASIMASENPHFDRVRFLAACGL